MNQRVSEIKKNQEKQFSKSEKQAKRGEKIVSQLDRENDETDSLGEEIDGHFHRKRNSETNVLSRKW